VVWVVTTIVARNKETVYLERETMKRWNTVGCSFEKETQEQRKQKYFGCRKITEKTNQGETMMKHTKVPLNKNMAETYRNGVWHRVGELSRLMDAHLTRMYKVKKYVKHTASLRKIMTPNAVWDGVNKSFEVDYNKEGVIAVPWLSNKMMSSDICTKNDGGSDFVRYRDVCVRDTP
jgi:hypothetical protein